MLTISSISKAEKNKLNTDSCFILIMDIMTRELYESGDYSTSSDVIRVCRNTEPVTWKGNIYVAFPFSLQEVSEDSTGSEPSFSFTLDNTSRALQGTIEDYNGGNGFVIILRVVNSENLDDEADVEEMFSVKHTVCDQNQVTFTVGSMYPLNSRRPLDRYMKNNCPYTYKGLRCGCTDKYHDTCSHTLTACRQRNNSKRFGGFAGIDQKGMYLND